MLVAHLLILIIIIIMLTASPFGSSFNEHGVTLYFQDS